MDYGKILKNLEKRGYRAVLCSDGREAVSRVLDIVGDGTVGIGGSVTVKQIGAAETFRERGNSVHWHWLVEKERMDAERRMAMQSDYYLCSANALTEDGQIVNIDGTGNRVAATMYGPKNVVMIVGKNKITDSVDSGIERIRRECCPHNARRLGLKTPCAVTGICTDCSSPQRMCNVFSVLERKSKGIQEHYVILVDEKLGY